MIPPLDGERVLALTEAAVLFVLAALHMVWAVRGVDGSSAIPSRADGVPLFRPSRAATLLVALALGAAGSIVLGREALAFAGVPMFAFRVGIWGVAIAFAARTIGEFRYVGLFKRERHTRFARLDTMLFTPLCAALATGATVLALR